MADLLDIRPERMDSDQKLLRKILAAINLWQGGIVPGQSGRITIDSSGGAGAITVVPNPGDGTAGITTSDRVGGYTTTWIYSPTLTTAAYTAGDSLGTRTPLLSVLRAGICSGILQSLAIYDAAGQKAAIDFLIFNAEPSSSTTTDNGAVAIDSADIPKLLGKISIADSDYVDLAGGAAIATLANLGLVVKSGTIGTGLGSGTLWVVPMVQGTPTYAANSLQFTFGILQD